MLYLHYKYNLSFCSLIKYKQMYLKSSMMIDFHVTMFHCLNYANDFQQNALKKEICSQRNLDFFELFLLK